MTNNWKAVLAMIAYFNIGMVVGVATYEPPPPECGKNMMAPFAGQCSGQEVEASYRGAFWPVYLVWRFWWGVLR